MNNEQFVNLLIGRIDTQVYPYELTVNPFSKNTNGIIVTNNE